MNTSICRLKLIFYGNKVIISCYLHVILISFFDRVLNYSTFLL
jgi:hypothetical protein